MRVAVTGASGFLGRKLVAALRAAGHTVTAVVRASVDPARRAALHVDNVNIVTSALDDELGLGEAFAGVDAVFHLAGLVDCERSRAEAEAVNLVGTEAVLAAARGAKVRRLVYASCEAVTRSDEARSYVDETHPQPSQFYDPVTETRALAEDLVVAASDAAFETVTLRFGRLWGVGDTSLLPGYVREARAGRVRLVGGGRSLLSTCYVDNAVDALGLAMTREAASSKLYYVTDDERVSWRSYLSRLHKALGLPEVQKNTPYAVAWLSAWLSDRVQKASRGARSRLQADGVSFHFNIQRARNELGYAPRVSLDEGFAKMKAWVAAVGVEAIARGEAL